MRVAKLWALFALVNLHAADFYAIKYEPVTRQCDFFVNLEYSAHVDLAFDEDACLFLLPKPVDECTLLQRRNAGRSEVKSGQILLQAERFNRVAFNGYLCE